MSRVPRGALYAAFLLSGVTALIYQVIWSRYLTLLVGGTSVAHTIVLATFMGGLAFGNAFFGRWADHPSADRLRLYALLEVGIGLACMLFPTFFGGVSSAYLSLAGIAGPGAAVNDVLKALLAAASMLLPCVFMGGTLPVLAKYVVDSMSGFGRRLGFLYFINTAGAVLGCVLGGFYVVETWGLEAGMVAAALVNLAIGGVFYLWSKRLRTAAAAGEAVPAQPRAEAHEEGPVAEHAYTTAQARVAFWSIAVAGAVSMLYELAWTRLLTISIGGTVHSFSTMLVSFISGIAIGSALAARLLRRPRNALVLFGLCEIGVSLSILLPLHYYERLPYAVHRMGSWLAHGEGTYPLYLFLQVVIAAAVMLVPTTLIGAALPLASRVCVERLEVVGRRVGSVFSVNTIGTVVGAVITGFVLLPRIGLERTLLLGCMVSGVLGIVLLRAWRPRVTGSPAQALADAFRPSARTAGPALWPLAAGMVAAAALAALIAPRWDPRTMQQALFRWGTGEFTSWDELRANTLTSKFLYVRDGADGTIAVQERTPANRVIRVNGKPDASTISDMPTQLMVGHLPMLLHPDPRTAMVVGLGSGATVSAVLRHPGVQADVAEISPEMVQAARFFDAWNGHVLDNPRMKLHVVDAREFLLLTRKHYDVIASEPTNIWVPGVANLFTREFYQVVHAHLNPGGLFTQWLHSYTADPAMVASIVATVSAEFPYVSAWLVADGDLILLAGEQRPAFDPDRFSQRLAALRPSLDVPQEKHPNGLIMFDNPVLFLAHQIGTAEAVRLTWPAGTAPTYQDKRPSLEFQAARAQYRALHYPVREHVDGRLTHMGGELLFLEEYLARYPVDPSKRLQLARDLGVLGAAFTPLKTAVTADVVLGGTDDASALFDLPESLLAALTMARALGAGIDAGHVEPLVCEGYLETQHTVLREARSVFGTPRVEEFENRVARCIAARPADEPLLHAQLARALADAGADAAALGWIRKLEQDGSLGRIAKKEASDVLVAGAVLLLRSGSYDGARPWAERALELDHSNAAAARIILALRVHRSPAPVRTVIAAH